MSALIEGTLGIYVYNCGSKSRQHQKASSAFRLRISPSMSKIKTKKLCTREKAVQMKICRSAYSFTPHIYKWRIQWNHQFFIDILVNKCLHFLFTAATRSATDSNGEPDFYITNFRTVLSQYWHMECRTRSYNVYFGDTWRVSKCFPSNVSFSSSRHRNALP